MGLMDFFRKGKEKPVSSPQQRTPGAGQTSSGNPGQSTQAGTTAGQATNAPRPGAQTQRDYVVQSGDSLSKIARQFYGNANEWNKIYQANKDKIKDPNLIHPGQKLIIP
jgi:nucleoid-associated protein YgaU